MKNLSSKTVLLIVLIALNLGVGIYQCQKYGHLLWCDQENEQSVTQNTVTLPVSDLEASKFPWPPKLNEKYPDIPFVKPDGSVFKMSELKGRYVVIHYRGTTCPACQNMARRREGMSNDPRVVDVDILLFNDQMKPATAADADKWAKQYGFQEINRELVLGAPSWTHVPDLYQTTYDMVIGGQLLDKDGIVRGSVVRSKGEKLPSHYWPDLRSMLDDWLK